MTWSVLSPDGTLRLEAGLDAGGGGRDEIAVRESAGALRPDLAPRGGFLATVPR